ncbi:MAG: phosphotyrosine protein phosphatase [Pseudomonadota bacterium]
MTKNYLFVCSQNKWRSPTAEQIFSERTDIRASSAGTNNDAENPLDAEQIEWADVIIAMERRHRSKIQQRYKSVMNDKKIVVLGIPDNYRFMDPDLIELLLKKMRHHLPD